MHTYFEKKRGEIYNFPSETVPFMVLKSCYLPGNKYLLFVISFQIAEQ